MNLLPVAEAQARLFAMATLLQEETVPVADAVGRWMAQDLTARRDQPWAALSAMDGYAVRASGYPGPWRVTQESAAGGALPDELGTGEACRIFTGAPLPMGADAILIQENALLDGAHISAGPDPLPAGKHVRNAASDFASGAVLLKTGAAIGASQAAVAVLGGHDRLPVRRRVKVAILSTGNELVPPGTPAPPGSLPASNGPMLAAMLANLPCEIIDLGIVPDDLAAITAAFGKAQVADIVVSTGGASVGDHDLVRPAFEQAGGSLDFWKIRMRPGKPLMAGRMGTTSFLGLPGNPVSAYVTAILFLLPLVRRISGAAHPLPHMSEAKLASSLPQVGDRDDYLRAYRQDGGIVSVTSQDSAATAALALADCLIVRAAGSARAEPGDRVSIIPL